MQEKQRGRTLVDVPRCLLKGKPHASRQLAKGVLDREGILDLDNETLERVTSPIDRSMRSKKDVYLKGGRLLADLLVDPAACRGSRRQRGNRRGLAEAPIYI